LEGGLGKQQMFIKLKEQQKEIAELGMAYREERTRRKAIQRDLRREQEAKERLMMEVCFKFFFINFEIFINKIFKILKKDFSSSINYWCFTSSTTTIK
jgi:hypothetical protein